MKKLIKWLLFLLINLISFFLIMATANILPNLSVGLFVTQIVSLFLLTGGFIIYMIDKWFNK